MRTLLHAFSSTLSLRLPPRFSFSRVPCLPVFLAFLWAGAAFPRSLHAEEPPAFPTVGVEYRFTLPTPLTDEDDDMRRAYPPFHTDRGDLLVLRWLGGSWYQVAFQPASPADQKAALLQIANLNVSRLLTLTELPEGTAWIAKALDAQKEAFAEKRAVTVLGQVKSPGRVPIPEGQDHLDVLEAIQAAGDLASVADLRNVRVLRLVDGVQKTFPLNLRDLLGAPQEGAKDKQTFALEAGDVVFVPLRVFD